MTKIIKATDLLKQITKDDFIRAVEKSMEIRAAVYKNLAKR
jgi:hypothetical protein